VENGKFVLGDADVVFNASSAVNQYGYTVNYVDVHGNTLAESVTGQSNYGSTVNAPLAEVTGYTAPTPARTITIGVDESANVVTYVYSINQYDVIYKVDGITEYADTFDYGTQVTIRATYPKTGYTVDPWQTDSGITIVDGKFVLGAETVTFTAASLVNAYGYTINYKDGSGKAIADPVTGTANYGTTVDAQIIPVTGYTSPAAVIHIAITENPSANVADYIYSIITYTLTFDDGTVQTDRTYTVENKSVEIPPITEKKGYTGSWEPFEYDLTDKTIGAVYIINEYTVTFTVDDAVYDIYSLEYDSVITAPAQNPTKSSTEKFSYTFLGWEGFTVGMKISDSDIVFKALFDETVIPSQNPDKTYDVDVEGDHASFASDTLADIIAQATSDPSVTMDVTMGDIKVAFDNASLKTLNSSRADLFAKTVDPAQMSQAVKDIVGDNPVYDLSFGNNTDFGNGKVTVTVPYTLAAGKTADNLTIYYIAFGHVYEEIPCTYSDGYVTFTTNHFSTYAVMYVKPPSGSEFPIMYVAIGAIAVLALAGGAVVVMKRRS